jgi:hypothetical protein
MSEREECGDCGRTYDEGHAPTCVHWWADHPTRSPDSPDPHEHRYSTVYEVGWPDSLEVCGCGHILTALLPRSSDSVRTPPHEVAIRRVRERVDHGISVGSITEEEAARFLDILYDDTDANIMAARLAAAPPEASER